MSLPCPVCGVQMWFDTDGPCGLGIVRAVHPSVRCVPRVVVYLNDAAPDVDDDGRLAVRGRRKRSADSNVKPRHCANRECRKVFTPEFTRTMTCSNGCAVERQRQIRRKYYEENTGRERMTANRRYAKRQRPLARWRAA